MQDLYHKKVMDYYTASTYRGLLDKPDLVADATSASCGDHVIFHLQCKADTITAIKFQGEGSILGQAVAAMLCERFINRSFGDLFAFTPKDLDQLLGVELGPTRMRTVIFMLETLQAGVRSYAQSRISR